MAALAVGVPKGSLLAVIWVLLSACTATLSTQAELPLQDLALRPTGLIMVGCPCQDHQPPGEGGRYSWCLSCPLGGTCHVIQFPLSPGCCGHHSP